MKNPKHPFGRLDLLSQIVVVEVKSTCDNWPCVVFNKGTHAIGHPANTVWTKAVRLTKQLNVFFFLISLQ